tara:strand:- start:954 stop:1931 length:978 start_codon:yes stop_codon:yes gene_type:complete
LGKEQKSLDNVLAANGLFDQFMQQLGIFGGRPELQTQGANPNVLPNTEEGDSFLDSPELKPKGLTGGPEQFVPFDVATDEQIDKLYNAIHYAEWGGEYDKPFYASGMGAGDPDYFTRTHETPAGGSSAYGPVQLTGGLLAGYFGNKKMLESLPKNQISETLISRRENGVPSRGILTDEEKDFVDALIMQAYNFSYYGNEPERKDEQGYSPNYEYGGRGDIEEQFPDNYKQLYERVAKKIIKLQLDSVDGDEIAFAKKWKAGPEKFTDKEYLKKFKKGLKGATLRNDPFPVADPTIDTPPSKPDLSNGFLPKTPESEDFGYGKITT